MFQREVRVGWTVEEGEEEAAPEVEEEAPPWECPVCATMALHAEWEKARELIELDDLEHQARC